MPEQARCVHFRSCWLCPDSASEVNLPAAHLAVLGLHWGAAPETEPSHKLRPEVELPILRGQNGVKLT